MVKGPQDSGTDKIDEHNQPTEPMPSIILPSPLSPGSHGAPTYSEETVPVPQSAYQPYPQQQVQGSVPQPPPFPNMPGNTVYPYLPSIPRGYVGNGEPPAIPAHPLRPRARSRSRPSFIPTFVGMCFVALQFLLLLRFALKILNVAPGVSWVNIIYTLSSLFLLPFYLILQQFTLPITIDVELYTLLAILLYGVLSRILVRVLKVVLNAR